MASIYDEYDYPCSARIDSHPHRLAGIRAQFGLPFVAPERCRVLDIGCNDGSNIIAMAAGAPHCRFHGFDLSEAMIDRGRARIAALGLDNISLAAGDISTVDLEPASFDYVVANGIYAWVPPAVQTALLALIGRVLSPDGAAYVNYNVFPGARLRQTVRDMLLHALRGVSGGSARRQAVKAWLDDYVSTEGATPHLRLVKDEAKQMRERIDTLLLFDELGPCWDPVFHADFAAAAARHGLQFLTDAEPNRIQEGQLGEAGGDTAAAVEACVRMDFDSLFMFRQSVVIPAAAAVDRRRRPALARGLHVAGNIRREGDLFKTSRADIEVAGGGFADILERIGDAWPSSLPVASLVENDMQATQLLSLQDRAIVELLAEPWTFATAGEHPLASPLARDHARTPGKRITNLRMDVLAVPDGPSRHFITLLDGSRDRAALAAAMGGAMNAPVAAVAAELDHQLATLARLALLLA